MKNRRKIIALGILMLVLLGWSAAGFAAEEPVVVASTSWVALMVKAAGVDNVTILAPVELRHPPEYDYLPSDIALVTQADYLVWAGYEPFIKKLVEAADFPAERLVQTVTTNVPANLREQTRKLAAIFGTEHKQAQWEEEFNAFIAGLQQKALEQKVGDIPVLVNFHQQAFVKWLGYDVIGVFTPDEMSPAKMAELAGLGPAMVIDNYHNPSGEGIAAIAGVPYVQLANFPSKELDSLMALMEDNARRLGIIE